MNLSLGLATFLFCVTVGQCHEGVPRRGPSVRNRRNILITEKLTTPKRAHSEGYPVETHHVTTEDGYILELHRIPRGRGQTQGQGQFKAEYHGEDQGRSEVAGDGKPRPVVLLMHCFLCSSLDWLMNFPDKALGFILADDGYDVWLMNARGNLYSRNHTYLSPKSPKFWQFSFHEIAVYDIAASVDYALEVSGTERLSYMGFSMGSNVFLTFISERPEYTDKIQVAALLGPASYMTHSDGTMFHFSGLERIIEKWAELTGMLEIKPGGAIIQVITGTLCSKINLFLNELCLAIFSNIVKIDEKHVNRDTLPFVLSHMISGGSVRTIVHLMQLKNSGRFQQYSHGKEGNRRVYGTQNPPLYNLSSISVPVALFSAKGDVYVKEEDVSRLARELPNVALKYKVDDEEFSHFDFLWAKDPTEILYKHVLELLEEYL